MARKYTHPYCEKYEAVAEPPYMTADQRRRNEEQVEWLRRAIEAQNPPVKAQDGVNGGASARR